MPCSRRCWCCAGAGAGAGAVAAEANADADAGAAADADAHADAHADADADADADGECYCWLMPVSADGLTLMRASCTLSGPLLLRGGCSAWCAPAIGGGGAVCVVTPDREGGGSVGGAPVCTGGDTVRGAGCAASLGPGLVLALGSGAGTFSKHNAKRARRLARRRAALVSSTTPVAAVRMCAGAGAEADAVC